MRKSVRKLRRQLKQRWIGEEPRIEAIINDIRTGKDWTKNLIGSEERGWKDIPFLSTCPSRFIIPGEVAPRDLRGLELENIDLSGTDGLANSCMDFCQFKGVLLDSASLIGASLQYSKASGGCVFNRADLQFADLRNTDFSGVSFEGATFIRADARGANFTSAILIGAKLKDFEYSEEPWWGFMVPGKCKKWTRFGGEYQSTTLLDSETSSLIAKFLEGENLGWRSSRKYPILGFIWYILANYGRSAARLLFWVFMIWVIFGFIYAGYPLPTFLEDTSLGEALCWLSPEIDWNGTSPTENLFRPYYFSAVTMTTLGFGDITPNPLGWKAQLYVCVQAFFGYLMLGVFIGVLIQNASSSLGSNLRPSNYPRKVDGA